MSMKAARISDVHPEFVFLGFLAEKPVHGYELYRRFCESFGTLWHISESQMYATLKRLDARGWTVQGDPAESGAIPGVVGTGPASVRRIISITDEGRSAFSQWLSTPSAVSPRALRLEFLPRLFFASRLGDASLLIGAQRAALESELRSLISPDRMPGMGIAAEADGTARINILAADFRVWQVRAALKWIKTLTHY